MTLTAVVFDLDGTLIDTAPDLMRATNAVLADNQRPPVSLGEIRQMVGQGARRLIERGFALTGDPIPADEIEPLYRSFVDHYMANIAIDSRPFPGVIELLETCAAAGIRMAVCTNKLEPLSVRLIEELNLSDFFGAIIGPDTIDVAKPDAAPYLEAVRRTGGEVSQSIMIGDNETDIRTARAAGVPSIGVSFGYTDRHISEFDPDHVVDHFDEIWPILADHYNAGRTSG